MDFNRWQLGLRVRSDNIRYPLNLCSFGVGTIPPVPRFLRLSWFLATYTSLTANVFLAAHAITACTLSTMGAPLPYRSSILYWQTSYRQSHVSS
jgi:hypothetical protein